MLLELGHDPRTRTRTGADVDTLAGDLSGPAEPGLVEQFGNDGQHIDLGIAGQAQQDVARIGMALPGGTVDPAHRFGQIALHALARGIGQADGEFGVGMPLGRSLFPPVEGTPHIHGQAVPVGIQPAQVVLRLGMPLFGQRLPVAPGLGKIAFQQGRHPFLESIGCFGHRRCSQQQQAPGTGTLPASHSCSRAAITRMARAMPSPR